MNKLNKELIAAKDKIEKINKKIKKLQKKEKYLSDKIHTYFDSETIDTQDTEEYILNYFWKDAYSKYIDGGFITNDPFVVEHRFAYEIKKLDKIIKKNCINRTRALDIACGNGRYTREFATHFNEVVGIDLSQERIQQNSKENNNQAISYIAENFVTVPKEKLGTFDFIYVGGLFTYLNKEIDIIYSALLKLLKKDGILILREGVLKFGEGHQKSKNYIAYYKNVNFYTEGIFKKKFYKKYRNYGYNVTHLHKYFNVKKEKIITITKNPLKIEKIVKNHIDNNTRQNYFYLYKK